MAIAATIFFSLGAAAWRLAPHAPNLAPVAALALFAGAYLPRRWSWAPPLFAMLASDALIGFYDLRLMAVVYGALMLPVLLGRAARRTGPAGMIGSSLLASIIFYLTTNAAVWVLSEWYPHTLSGLLTSYTLGLPFFRNTLAGDLLFSGIFFGFYAAIPRLRALLRCFSGVPHISWISRPDIL